MGKCSGCEQTIATKCYIVDIYLAYSVQMTFISWTCHSVESTVGKNKKQPISSVFKCLAPLRDETISDVACLRERIDSIVFIYTQIINIFFALKNSKFENEKWNQILSHNITALLSSLHFGISRCDIGCQLASTTKERKKGAFYLNKCTILFFLNDTTSNKCFEPRTWVVKNHALSHRFHIGKWLLCKWNVQFNAK